jgi:hypothetical protein
MKRVSGILKVVTVCLLLVGTAGFISEKNLPVIHGRKGVATVNGEPIFLDELKQYFPPSATPGQSPPTPEEVKSVLKRLINTRLIIQEAKRMGLDQLREIQMQQEVFARVALREALMERCVKNIHADEKEVEKAYRASVKEYKVKSILFEKEEDARRMEQAIQAGKGFEETFKNAVSQEIAKAKDENHYYRGKDLLPEIARAVSQMKVGSVSPVIHVPTGFTLLKLEAVRFPENVEVRERIRKEALIQKQKDALIDYDKQLTNKYAKLYPQVLKSVDFDAKEPGFQALLKDRRVIAEIQGEKPITIGDLAENMQQNLFHGVDQAIENKRLNRQKGSALDEMVRQRVFRHEALRLGLDKTENYKNRVREHEDSLLFGAFVSKAVSPDVKLKEEDVKAYYQMHRNEFTYPEMMRIKGLVFAGRQNAEEAMEKLRKGADFQWVKANQEGQLDPNTGGVMTFDGNLLTVKDLPPGIQKAVSGARSGHFRLYASPENHYYVLAIQETIPPQTQPYDEVRGEISKKIYEDKLKQAVEDSADKLRGLSEVKIYLK